MNGPLLSATPQRLLTIPSFQKSSLTRSTSPSSPSSNDALDLATPQSGSVTPISDLSSSATARNSLETSRPSLRQMNSDYATQRRLKDGLLEQPTGQKALVKPFKAFWSLMKKVPTWYADEVVPKLGNRRLVGTRKEGGARTAETLSGTIVLMNTPLSATSLSLNDVVRFGQSRHAAQLVRLPHDLSLARVGYTGKTVPITEGWYSFIIDQRERLLVNSWGGAGKTHGIKGAHANLSGGLPVLFAGELQIQKDRVIALNARSGSYRTPARLLSVALAHPLLVNAKAVAITD